MGCTVTLSCVYYKCNFFSYFKRTLPRVYDPQASRSTISVKPFYSLWILKNIVLLCYNVAMKKKYVLYLLILCFITPCLFAVGQTYTATLTLYGVVPPKVHCEIDENGFCDTTKSTIPFDIFVRERDGSFVYVEDKVIPRQYINPSGSTSVYIIAP